MFSSPSPFPPFTLMFCNMCILLLGGKQGEEEDDDDGSNGGVKWSEVKWSGDWLEDALIYEDWLNGYRMTMYVCMYICWEWWTKAYYKREIMFWLPRKFNYMSFRLWNWFQVVWSGGKAINRISRNFFYCWHWLVVAARTEERFTSKWTLWGIRQTWCESLNLPLWTDVVGLLHGEGIGKVASYVHYDAILIYADATTKQSCWAVCNVRTFIIKSQPDTAQHSHLRRGCKKTLSFNKQFSILK